MADRITFFFINEKGMVVALASHSSMRRRRITAVFSRKHSSPSQDILNCKWIVQGKIDSWNLSDVGNLLLFFF